MSTKDEVARLERELANMALDAKQVRGGDASAMIDDFDLDDDDGMTDGTRRRAAGKTERDAR